MAPQKTGPVGPVLLVEDDRATREMIRIVLEQAGMEVLPSASGHDALAQARLRAPRCAVVDLHLPVVDGQTVCMALFMEHGANLPILLMSASSEHAVASTSGAYDFIYKPFDIDDFLAKVRQGLRLSEDREGLREEVRDSRRRLEAVVEEQRRSYQAGLFKDGEHRVELRAG